MSRHLVGIDEGRDDAILEYDGDDERLPEAVRAFNRAAGVESLLVAPLRLPPRNARLDRARRACRIQTCERQLAARAARCHGAAGDAGAVLQPAGRAEPARGAAPGGARRAQPDRARHSRHAGAGIRRHPDAAAGGAARRRRRACRRRRRAASRPPSISRARISSRRAGRWRRCGPHVRRSDEDVPTALERMVDLAQRTSDVPVELAIDELPPFDRRRRARDHRHRAGSADQRRPPRARAPHRRARRRGARRRLPAVGGRRRPRASPAIAARPASA